MTRRIGELDSVDAFGWDGRAGLILVRSDSPREDGAAKKHRPTLSRTIYLLTGAILLTVIVFPSVATSPVNWTLAPAFAASAAKF
jgi:hypothetical protein